MLSAQTYDQGHERHAITFATLSTILADVISEHSDTDIELIIGCKSAKDRSTSVVAGINLLYPFSSVFDLSPE